jgi:hypothetical protein
MSGGTAAERLLMQLGISKAQDIDLDAIAWHVGAAVKYRRMDSADATIVGSSKHAVIAINSSAIPTRRRFSLAHELGHWHHHRGEFFFAVPPISETLPAGRSTLSGKRIAFAPKDFSDYLLECIHCVTPFIGFLDLSVA